MKGQWQVSLLSLVLTLTPGLDAQTKPALTNPRIISAREIAAKVSPSVVLIITLDENDKPIGQGSGFVYDPGLVVSNLHVFERATNAIVKNVVTGKTSKALKIVGMNAKDDICVIRIDNTNFPPVQLGDSGSVRMGDEIFVVSNPKGLEGSFAKGIVSSVRSDLGLFQIDAAISSGSSGGVLLNQRAEAIGIIKSSLMSGQNLNFAIPIAKLLLVPHQFKHSIQLAGAVAYTHLKRERLKGPVQKITYRTLPINIAAGNRTSSSRIVIYEANFNRDGNTTESRYFDGQTGEFIEKIARTYHQSGLVAKQTITTLDGKVDDWQVDFDSAVANTIKSRQFSGTFGPPERLEVFDASGNQIRFTSTKERVEAEFDINGLEVQSFHYHGGKLTRIRRYTYKYDSFGNWTEKIEAHRILNIPGIDPNRWFTFTGETEYREITYYN